MKKETQTQVDLKVQGNRGTEPTYRKNIGYAVISEGNNTISMDAFKGWGDSYQKRDCAEISIIENGNPLFIGTFEELKKILENKQAVLEYCKNWVY
jgi:hypothetical protein